MSEIIFNGPSGRIEGRYYQSQEPGAPVAVILHPHPVYGGTMNNKVVYHMFQSFVRQGFSVLRFNFRGVGRSQGTFDQGIGELSDAAAALDWIQQQNPDASSYWISGFSFGAWIALQLLMRRPEIEGFVAVSPPANLYDFSFLSPCPAAGLVVQGTSDDVVNEKAVADLVGKLSSQKGTRMEYKVIQGADHYFRNHLDELGGMLDVYVADKVQEIIERRRARADKKRRQPPRDALQSSKAS
jgi:alpha/beta superfamily hydrolase